MKKLGKDPQSFCFLDAVLAILRGENADAVADRLVDCFVPLERALRDRVVCRPRDFNTY